MALIQATGPGAASRKYDVLTALGTYALGRDRRANRLVLRLITLITARYNWRLNELSAGRREIARLWSVDERTVKRELAALKTMGFLSVKRPGARGRVTVYRLEIDAIYEVSKPDWERVGPDFAERMAYQAAPGPAPPATDKVVPFVRPPDAQADCPWTKVKAHLYQITERARYTAWYDKLAFGQITGRTLVLIAPSSFHANYVETHLYEDLKHAATKVLPSVDAVALQAQ